jgi:hypothetical protein
VALEGLDTRATFTLLAELDDTVAHARAGLRAVRQLRYDVEDWTTVLTLLSIAAEKTLKIAVGLHNLDRHEPWPTKSVMRNYGHDVNALWSEVHAIYTDRLAAGAGPPFAQASLEATAADPVAEALLSALSNWGSAGRFHRLDELAGQPQPGPPPLELVEDIEQQIYTRDPSIIARLGEVDGYDGARAQMNGIMVEALRGWWRAHVDTWTHGVLGPGARQLSTELRRALAD